MARSNSIMTPYKQRIALNNRAQLKINNKKNKTAEDEEKLRALSEDSSYQAEAQNYATRVSHARFLQDHLQKLVNENGDLTKSSFGNDAFYALKNDSKTMQKSVYRKYYDDYMNTADYQKASYNDKQQYLTEQEKDAKKDKWANILGSIMNTVASASSSQYPTKTNQAMAQNFNKQAEKAAEGATEASQRQKVYNQYKADLFNEEYTEKNLAIINEDKELSSLVEKAYKEKTTMDCLAKQQSKGLAQPDNYYVSTVQAYNSLMEQIHSKGYDANSLLDAYTREQNRIFAKQQEKRDKELANKVPALASAAYVAANAFQMGAVPEIISSGVANALNGEYKPMDTNTLAFAPTRFRGTVSKTVSENIQRETLEKTNSEFWSHAASFAYQTGLSIGDFASVALLPEPVSLAIMGTGAGVTAVKDATDRGVSADQALMTGLWAGAAEIVFEKVSLEKFNALRTNNKTGVVNFVKNILKQSFTEGSEEVFTDIANAIGDQLINGDMSELKQHYKEFVEEFDGDTDKAQKALAKLFGLQLLESYAGGALSGSIMGSFGTAMNNYNLSRIGKNIRSGNSDLINLTNLFNVVEKLDRNGEAQSLAQKLTKKSNVTNAQIGKLYVDTINEVAESFNSAETLEELSQQYEKVAEYADGSLLTEISRSAVDNAERIKSEQRSENIPATTISDNNTFSIPVTTASGNRETITNVAATYNGDITFKTDSGETVSIDDVDLPNNSIKAIVADASTFGTSGAAVFIKNAVNRNMNNSHYRTFAEYSAQMYKLGVVGSPWKVISRRVSPMINTLGYSTAKAFYDAGAMDFGIETRVKDSINAVDRTKNKSKAKSTDGKYTNKTGNNTLDEFYEAVSKKLHLDIVYQNSNNFNGSLDAAKGKVTINEGAKRGDVFTLGHEAIGEVLRAYNRNDYNNIVDTIIEYAAEASGAMDTADLISAYYHTYLTGKSGTTIQDAREEFANDLISALFFGNEQGQKQFVEYIMSDSSKSAAEKKTFLEKLKDCIDKIISNIRQAVNSNNFSQQEKAVANMEIKKATEFRTQILKALDTAVENSENADGVVNENNKYYSKKLGGFANINIDSNNELSYYGIPNTARALNDYVGIQKSVISKLKADDFFNQNNNIVVNADTDIVVEVTPNGIRETLSSENRYAALPRKIKEAKLATIRSLPDFIKYAEVKELNQPNYHKNKMTSFLVLEHPCIVDGNNFNVELKIRKTPQGNKFYIHQLQLKKTYSTWETDAENSDTRSLKSRNMSINNISPNSKTVNKENTENISATRISDSNGFNIPVMHNGNKTTITNVAATYNGDITFKTDSGETVSIDDVDLPNNSIKAIVTDASTFGTSGAAVFIKNAVNRNMNNSHYRTFAEYSEQMYKLGVVGSPWKVISRRVSPMINTLGYSTAKAFYDAGVADNKVLNNIQTSKKRIAEFNQALKAKTTPGATVLADKISKAQKAEIDLLGDFAKSIGREIIVVSDTEELGYGRANGFYTNGKIVLALNADGGMISAYFGHELFHDLKATSENDAQKLEDFVIEHLKKQADYDYEERVDKLIELNKFKGTREQQIAQANEEIAANACLTVFSEQQNFENLVRQDKSLAQKVRDFFADFIDKIKNALQNISDGNAEYKALKDDVSAKEKILSMFDECLKNLQENNTVENSGVKCSLTENFDDNTDFTENINKVVKMSSVCDMKGTEFAKGKTDLITQVSYYFDSLGNVVHSKYGDIVLNRTGVKSSLGHGLGRNKAIAFTAVPNVIENGEIIDYKSNYKNRKYDTAVFAAPVTISNEKYFMATVVNVNKQSNEYYLHEVALQKKEDNVSFKTGNSKNATPSDTKSSIYSLLNKLQNVNSNDMQDKPEYSRDVNKTLANSQENITITNGSDIKYSLVENITDSEGNNYGKNLLYSKDINSEMNDKQRAEIISNSFIKLVEYRNPYDLNLNEIRNLENTCNSKAEGILKKLGEKFNVFNWYKNANVDLEFQYSRSSLSESIHKQGNLTNDFCDFAKLLYLFDDVVANAVPIEVHTDKYVETKRQNRNLKYQYVLLGAFKDNDNIVPVQFEIREQNEKSNQPNKMYVSITLGKIKENNIKATVPFASNETQGKVAPLFSTISVPSLIKNVNAEYGNFFKYVPCELLNEQQIISKNKALAADEERLSKMRADYKTQNDDYMRKKQ